MSQIGTVVSNTETPAATTTPFDTGNAFMVGLADWGPAAAPVTIQSLPNAAATVGPRSGTNATAYDSLDVFFREGGQTAFFSRVVGPGASAASLVLRDGNGSASLLVNAVYVGNYGNEVQVAVANAGASYTITLTDTLGNALAVSPALTTKAAAQTWAATVGYVVIDPLGAYATLPATVAATPLSGGTDDRTHVGLTQWAAALNSFPATLGPGQLLAPGVTNTTVSGIWASIGAAALGNNRVGICDMDDGVAASVQVSNIGTAFNAAGVGPLGFWAGNVSAPGVVPGTTRSIAPSPVIAALCARADATGNPNQAAAGSSFPLQYVTGSFTLVSGTTETYSPTDASTLNSAGINSFATRFGVFENFGFVSSLLPTTDAIYWQFNHARLRMAIAAASQVLAEPYVFSQLDGQGSDIVRFASDLTNMLEGFYAQGALFGDVDTDAFSVNVGPGVNSPTTEQGGQLNAVLSVRMSPFAQLVDIVVNSVPITQAVPAGTTSTAGVATGLNT